MNEEKDSVAQLIRIAGRRPRVPESVKARVRGAVHDEWQNEVARRRRIRWTGGVAGLAAAAGIAAVLWLRPSSSPDVLLPVTATVIETATAATRTLEWGSGSLRLDSATRIRLESDRVATLESGAIYFSSGANGAGVEIRTPYGAIRDIGTQFEVRIVDDAVRVRVREGSIELRGRVAPAGSELVATNSALERRDIATWGEEWAWVERAAPAMTLEGLTFEEIVTRVAREKGLRAEWRDESSKAKRLRASTSFSPDEAIAAAAAAVGVRYSVHDGQLIVE